MNTLKLKIITIFILLVFVSLNLMASKIYVLPGNDSDYNKFENTHEMGLTSLGHEVIIGEFGQITLPDNFAAVSTDPDGYHYLCLFGNVNYSELSTEIQQFVADGGIVYFQYEVSCCEVSQNSTIDITNDLTGLSITTNYNEHNALNTNNNAGWEATQLSDCQTITGNAYRCLDGLPEENKLKATATLPDSSPSHEVCDNFGFVFYEDDFSFNSTGGAIMGMGDCNTWFDGLEPPNNSGTTPINMSVLNYFFPSPNSDCHLVEPTNIVSSNEVIPFEFLKVSPNPFVASFQINAKELQGYSFELFSNAGILIEVKKAKNDEEIEFITKGFTSGIYFLKITNGENTIIKKLIKM